MDFKRVAQVMVTNRATASQVLQITQVEKGPYIRLTNLDTWYLGHSNVDPPYAVQKPIRRCSYQSRTQFLKLYI